ncbi:RHS repeat-associated core domain-containing protein [Cystobacter ferrugineus]|uniref:Uncharacterized protein n=1 Tax=Cystobacter ferrugineus TaxID=83449 RepID=A0A1L9B4X3_9BACT|nr:RHS repeat-associated core domain-containing protein [Cystobacter ferrugineus]OJH37302.1 hypothetical protein BON30_28805 [Cystobacter ferrugineus]
MRILPLKEEALRQAASAGCLYAVLDACGSPSVPARILGLGEGQGSVLYRGQAAETFGDKAPYLARVDLALLAWIEQELWNAPWGIFLTCQAGFLAVETHLRRFLTVSSPQGDEWLFRFYDPRLLRPFLESCSEEEALEFFGPLESFILVGSSVPPHRLCLTARDNAPVGVPSRRSVGERFAIREAHLAALRPVTHGHVPEMLLSHYKEKGYNVKRDASTRDLVCTDARGFRTRLSFGSDGLPRRLLLATGAVCELEPDVQGRLAALVYPGGERMEMRYDENGHLAALTRPGLMDYQFTNDSLGRLRRVQHPDATVTRLDYGDGPWAREVIDRAGAATRYDYTPKGTLRAVIDPLGRQRRYECDADGRLSAICHPDGSRESFTHNADSHSSTLTLRDGRSVQRELDERGAPRAIHWPDGRSVQLRFDPSGRVLSAQDEQTSLSKRYDSLGRLIEEVSGDERITYGYDEAGNLTRMATSGGLRFEYEYDEVGRLRQARDGSSRAYGVEYTPEGSVQRLVYGNRLVEDQRHERGGRLTQARVQDPQGHLLSEQHYAYDVCERLISMRDEGASAQQQPSVARRFHYDPEGRLLLDEDVGDRGPLRTRAFLYDLKGNLIRDDDVELRIGLMDEPLARGGVSIEYDRLGNMLRLPGTQGELECRYSADSLLRELQVAGLRLQFSYDALGRRISKTDGLRTWRYCWSGHQLLWEECVSGPDAVAVRRTYFYLPGGTVPVSFEEAGHSYWLQHDARGSPIRVFDEQGVVVWQAHYDSFGQAHETIARVRQPWRLQGQYEDTESGLYYNFGRYYSPYLKSYLTRDPHWFKPDANHYSYCANDPWNKADPLGGFWHILGGAVVGAVIGGVIAAAKGENVWVGALEGAVVGAAFAVNPALGAAAVFAVDVIHQGIANGWSNICWSCAAASALIALVGGQLLKGLFSGLSKFMGAPLRSLLNSQWMSSLAGQLRAGASRLLSGLTSSRVWNLVSRLYSTCVGHPVDVATGKVFTEGTDFELPGPLPLKWTRVWYSCSAYQGPLGHGWHHSLDLALLVGRDVVVARLEDGRYTSFEPPRPGRPTRRGQEQLTLHVTEHAYLLESRSGLRYLFPRQDTLGEQVARLEPDASLTLPLARIEDSNGNGIDFHREHGRLTGIRDSAGRRLSIRHDPEGRILEITLSPSTDSGTAHCLVSYRYGPQGDLSEVRDALGHASTFDYRHHLLVQETDRTGFSFYFEYDRDDLDARCLRTWGDGRIYERRLQYDTNLQQTKVTDSRDASTVYEWNSLGLVTREVRPSGGELRFLWDEEGRKLMEVDANGGMTSYVYDMHGRLVAETNPAGATTTLRRDDVGNVTQIIDPLGQVWTQTYDERRNLTSTVDPLGHCWKYEVDGRGLLKRVVDPQGQIAELEWDGKGNLLEFVDRTGVGIRYLYDALGRQVKRTDVHGGDTWLRWDAQGNLLEVIAPQQRVSRFTYDPEGSVLSATDPQGRTQEYTYGPRGVLTSIRAPSGALQCFEYDLELEPTRITNALGQEWRFVRDIHGRICTEQTFDGCRLQYEYDVSNRLIAQINGRGQRILFDWDIAGRIRQRILADGSSEHFEYDALGRLVRARNNAADVTWKYDQTGQILEESCNGSVVRSTYDAVGNRISRQSPFGSLISLAHDAEGRLSRVDGPRGTLLKMEYDKQGRESKRSLVRDIASEREYSPEGVLQHSQTLVRGRMVLSRQYTYGISGQLLSVWDEQFGKIHYQRDVDGRLLSTQFPDRVLELYQYDGAGNVPGIPKTSEGAGVRDTFVEGFRLKYDEDGNLIEKQGMGERWEYTYNSLSQLVRAVGTRRGSAGSRIPRKPEGMESIVDFKYDPLGRRVEKLVTEAEGRSYRVDFLWDEEVLLGERRHCQQQDGPTSCRAGKDEEIEYFFRPNGFEPLLQIEKGEVYLVECDHLDTPHALVSFGGEVVWEGYVHGFGRLRETSGVANAPPFRFPGQYEDVETGLYYNRFRYYDPDLRQYTSRDPMGSAGGLEPWNYVPDPTGWVDPWGLISCYVRDFIKAYPKFNKFVGKGMMDIHHRIPQMYFRNGLFRGDKHALSNLYALPRDVHQKIVTPQWNAFSRQNPHATQADVVRFAMKMDKQIARYINAIGR